MSTAMQTSTAPANLNPRLEDPVRIVDQRFELLNFTRDTVRADGQFYTRYRRGSTSVLAQPRIASQGATGVTFYYTGDQPPRAVRLLVEDRPAWYSAVVVDVRRIEMLCALSESRITIIRRRLEQAGLADAGLLDLPQMLRALDQLPATEG